MIKRHYLNKERCGYRGSKQRYSVWKAEYNLKWERCHERQTHRLCADNGLNVEDVLIDIVDDDVRDRWHDTFYKLWDAGYRFKTGA